MSGQPIPMSARILVVAEAACPRCQAQPGSGGRQPSGRVREPHLERWEIWWS